MDGDFVELPPRGVSSECMMVAKDLAGTNKVTYAAGAG